MICLWKLQKQIHPQNSLMSSVMPPGEASYRFSGLIPTSMSVLQKTVNASSRHCFGSPKKARPGGHCRKSMDIGTRSTAVSGDGAMRVSLRPCMNIFTRRVNSLRSSWIRRWCGLTLVLRVPRKKRRTRRSVPRTKPGRLYDETESVSQRGLGSPAVDFDPWTPQRYNASICVDPRVSLRVCDSR